MDVVWPVCEVVPDDSHPDSVAFVRQGHHLCGVSALLPEKSVGLVRLRPLVHFMWRQFYVRRYSPADLDGL